ncbi:hypothetical protein LEM8419_00708 [Neolewinella maritima]|uniref:Gamma-glutamylcyclotransferase AIG2-like domain-containing protein n=1 Tax=Neolewinella maritima TaxID=1383882 RepID=A0ABN8F0H0_9BACT|nr:gamma-glutamylcyclotransferase family protein [Neolewinella maritima]CAH0999410.1 hypothetical protein LEM8419_00708 [Neolewinella maritima]
MSQADEYLFAYGTLRSDIPSSMSKFLRRRATLVGKATTSGRLIDLGGYPGFVQGGGTTTGELYRLNADRVAETWELLDAYEGVAGNASDEYRKSIVSVRVRDGGTFQARTYEYKQGTAGQAEIPNGDYPPFYRSNAAHQKFTGHD